ncbi:MAG: hypothetical protein K2G69_07010 [Muribaculaceae bacterium]|nr:hypothetical protein [Muribaculaceae bacterium]
MKKSITEIADIVLHTLELDNISKWDYVTDCDGGHQQNHIFYEDDNVDFDCYAAIDDDGKVEVEIDGYHVFGNDDKHFTDDEISELERIICNAVFNAA